MGDWTENFLIDLDPGHWSAPEGFPKSISPSGMFSQPTANGLEVVLASASKRPTAGELRKGWAARRARRASPVLLMVGYGDGGSTRVAVCGPVGEQPPLHDDLIVSQAERLAAAALAEPTHHAATRLLLANLPELDSPTPGLRNVGLLASQELRVGVPQRADWGTAAAKGASLLSQRGRDLVTGLGFEIDQLSTNASALIAGGSRQAVAVFLDEGESFDVPAKRFDSTPVSHGLAIADQQGLPWVVVARSSEIRLYAANADTGVGRKGRTETFVEVNLSLLPDDQSAYLHLLFSAEALLPNGSLEQILQRSEDFAADLADRLRERIYYETVPTLATAIASRMDGDPTEDDLADAYEQVMVILFRLLFVAYAEDKDLLPYRTNSRYADHSLSRIVKRLVEDQVASRDSFADEVDDLWEDVAQLWRAVDQGQRAWGVPAYNGGLFSTDPLVNPAGAALARVRLTDAEFGPALSAMLIDEGPEGLGPVDFRSLSVREFGTIYEGLLESQLSVAPTALTVDKKGNYVPTKGTKNVLVAAGSVYFHNRSGARKDSGSYFTKPFAVEHLLDHALEPALDDHIQRLDDLRMSGDDAAVSEAFFDFRCADIAMGSAHFLVAAVDRIEARLSAYLALNPIPAVSAELQGLRDAAYEALGDLGDGIEIESGSLLRRQVARRCIYGVDRNRVSVELARLAIWIHTFVPGLPLSFLDHNLAYGDSLTGVSTLDEALDALEPGRKPDAPSLLREGIENFLGEARKALRRLSLTSDASKLEVERARTAHVEALEAVAPATELFDVIAANRADIGTVPVSIEVDAIHNARKSTGVDDFVHSMKPLHFPTRFPEVFIRDTPGFDCILGNPPWEEATVEELGFWALRFPGLKAMKSGEQNAELKRLRRSRPDLVAELDDGIAQAENLRQILTSGQYPGMGKGDPDLYKAFCWRFWTLTREGGAVGVVLPRSALSAAGSAQWRATVLERGEFADVTITLNAGGWVFDDAEHRYTIGLISIRKGVEYAGLISLRGPYASLEAFERGVIQKPSQFPVEEFRTWSDGDSFPLLPSADAVRVFSKLRRHPRLDGSDIEREREHNSRLEGAAGYRVPRHGGQASLRARPMREFDATNDKHLWVGQGDSGPWPVYKGASFNIWNPDTGVRYGTADPQVVLDALQAKRLRQNKLARSVFSEFPVEWVEDPNTLPCLRPRIAFRDVARATDNRTVIAALVPSNLVITNQAPYLLFPIGDERDEAYLLGVLCSMPLDWYARRVVETHVNFHIFNGFPIPRPERNDPVRRRVEEIAGRLAAVDKRYSKWAKAVGVPVASVSSESERADLIAELDAAVAVLYGLDESDLRVIYGTFHEGADYSDRLAAVLHHHERLR